MEIRSGAMKQKTYAFVEHETIQAMVHSLFRFQTLEQAQMITNQFAEEFLLAPKMFDPLDKKTVVLWVYNLEVTDKEKKEGYLGNFGKITMHQLDSGKWTLTLAKLPVPLRKHPKRKPVPRRHPNMGHPVLRAASRNKTWPTMQDASAQLMGLHEEFPEISVPGLNKLKIMTYVRAEKGKSPVQRLELVVVKKDEGIYAIEIRQNLRKAPARPATPAPAAQPQDTAQQVAGEPAPAAEPAAAPGHFTKMVLAKNRRKKK